MLTSGSERTSSLPEIITVAAALDQTGQLSSPIPIARIRFLKLPGYLYLLNFEAICEVK